MFNLPCLWWLARIDVSDFRFKAVTRGQRGPVGVEAAERHVDRRDDESRGLPENSRETEVTAWTDPAAFRRQYPVVWLLTLVGPFALTGGVLFVLWELAGRASCGGW